MDFNKRGVMKKFNLLLGYLLLAPTLVFTDNLYCPLSLTLGCPGRYGCTILTVVDSNVSGWRLAGKRIEGQKCGCSKSKLVPSSPYQHRNEIHELRERSKRCNKISFCCPVECIFCFFMFITPGYIG